MTSGNSDQSAFNLNNTHHTIIAPAPQARDGRATLTSDPKRALDGVPRLLTLAETASLLRVHEDTVHRQRRTGRIASVRIGRRLLFEPQEVQRFITQQRQEGHGTAWGTKDSLNMASTGSFAAPTRRTCTSIGADRARDAYFATQRAQTILKKPSAS